MRLALISLSIILVALAGCAKPTSPEANAPPDVGRSHDGGVVHDLDPGLTMEVDPTHRTPASAYGGCTAIVMECFRQGRNRVDQCINDLRRCQTDEPWSEEEPCCSSACFDNFRRSRQMGMELGEALRATFIDGRDCMPGLGTAQ
jgi:hypothetical protein